MQSNKTCRRCIMARWLLFYGVSMALIAGLMFKQILQMG